MIVRIKTRFACWRRQKKLQKKLAIPAKLLSNGCIIRLGRRSGLRFGTNDEVCWIGVEERMGMGSSKSAVQRTSPGAKIGQWGFVPPFPSSFLPHQSTNPPLHESISPPLHSPRDFLQPFPPFSSVWGGGRWPPLVGGAVGKESGVTKH